MIEAICPLCPNGRTHRVDGFGWVEKFPPRKFCPKHSVRIKYPENWGQSPVDYDTDLAGCQSSAVSRDGLRF